MNYKIGMRIPPWIGAQGIEETAKWAGEVGIGILDVSQLTYEIKEVCSKYSIDIGSVDAVQTQQLLSQNESRRLNAAYELKQQVTDIAELGGRVLFMCLVPEDHTLPRKEVFAIWKEMFPEGGSC